MNQSYYHGHDAPVIPMASSRVCDEIRYSALLNLNAYMDKLGTSRIANTQPTYDFISGNPTVQPTQLLQQTFRQAQSQAVKAGLEKSRRLRDIGLKCRQMLQAKIYVLSSKPYSTN